MEISDFIIQNIWWKGKEYLKDEAFEEYREKKYKWQPGILNDLRLIPEIYTH